MRSAYDKDIEELHERNYSIYDDAKTEQSALKELRDRLYMIFDEEVYLNLLTEYYEEFDRIVHEISFVSTQNSSRHQNLFRETPRVTPESTSQKIKKKELTKNNVSEKTRKTLILEIVSMVERHINDSFSNRVFHITNNTEAFRHCNAIGKYDPVTKSFVLQKGSVLSLEVTSSYRYSAEEIQRRFFTQKNCLKKFDGFHLIKDVAFPSSSQAASYVLGRYADGKEEWIDDNGRKLGV